jgi:hypothetical protein
MRSRADFEAGLFFIVFGGATALLSLRYSLGTATEMGPGYFPLILGGLLTLIGIAVLVRSFAGSVSVPLDSIRYKPLIAVTAAVLLFAMLVMHAGLLIAIPVTVLVSLLAAEGWWWRSAIVIALVLTLVCYLVFVVGLEIRMPVLGAY